MWQGHRQGNREGHGQESAKLRPAAGATSNIGEQRATQHEQPGGSSIRAFSAIPG